jgi:hypothetical protein
MVTPGPLLVRYSMHTSFPLATAFETCTSAVTLRLSRAVRARLRAEAISCSVTFRPYARCVERRRNSATVAFFITTKV